jgi:hypothetical protein
MSTPTLEELQKQIDELEGKIEDLDRKMGSIEDKSNTFKKNIGDTNNLLGDAMNSVKAIRQDFSEFVVDTQKQYQYAEKLAETSKKTAVNMGLSVGRSSEFTKQFNRATSVLQKFGLEAADVNNIMTEYAEKSGRARILTPDEVLQIGLMEKGLGVSAENAAVLYERMSLMGVGAESASKSINEMVANSQKLGLNASKVAKTLTNNFDRMSTMSFKNGVQGMTKMAQLAVKMRMDVSDMLGMAEKFYEPEAAIEAAANLQMLGGDIAQAFGDPFETMYLARNKPEELAERVGDMVENMMQFNAETGEYEFPAEVRMQLKAAGEQLGINTDNMIDMARQAAKIKDIKMNVSSNIGDDEMREGLASMARLNKDGKYVIDFGNEELDIGDIGMDKAAEILAAPKDADEAIMDMAHNSMTTNEILKNILKAMKTGFVAESNVYEITEDVLRPGMKSMMEGVESQVQNAIKLLQDTPVGQFRKEMIEQAKDLGILGGEGLKEFFEKDFATTIAEAFSKIDWGDIFESDIKEIFKKVRTSGPKEKTKGQDEDDFLMRENGSTVSFSSEDDIIGAKKGGPLDKLMDKGLPNNMAGGTTNSKMEFGNLNISGRIEIVSPDGSATNMDMTSLKPQIEKMIINRLNNVSIGGTESSKDRIDTLGYG